MKPLQEPCCASRCAAGDEAMKRPFLLRTSWALLAGGVVCVAVAGWLWAKPQQRWGTPWVPPEAGGAPIVRCQPHQPPGVRLQIDGVQQWKKSERALFEELPVTQVSAGRHQGQPAVRVRDLLGATPGVIAIELIPCTGAPRRIGVAALGAGDPVPSIVINQKGYAKVIGPGRAIAKYLYGVNLVTTD